MKIELEIPDGTKSIVVSARVAADGKYGQISWGVEQEDLKDGNKICLNLVRRINEASNS